MAYHCNGYEPRKFLIKNMILIYFFNLNINYIGQYPGKRRKFDMMHDKLDVPYTHLVWMDISTIASAQKNGLSAEFP